MLEECLWRTMSEAAVIIQTGKHHEDYNSRHQQGKENL